MAPKLGTTPRGYGSRHQAARKAHLAAWTPGQACVRCDSGIWTLDDVDLDHTNDRQGYLGLAHSSCNRRHLNRPANRVKLNRICGHCGVMFHADRVYCSPECRREEHRHRKEERARRARPRRGARYRSAQRRAARAAKGRSTGLLWTSGPCGACGSTFTAVAGSAARWCSRKCAKRVEHCRARHGGAHCCLSTGDPTRGPLAASA